VPRASSATDRPAGPNVADSAWCADCSQVVQENIDEFGMEPEEALADAEQQFGSQGINLSNIVRRLPGASLEDDPAVVREVRTMLELLDEAEEEETLELPYADGKMKITFRRCGAEVAPKLSQSAATLRSECKSKSENVVLAGHQGAVDALISSALAMMQSPSALAVVLEALAVVLMNAENRERLGPRGVAVLVMLLTKNSANPPVLRAALQCCRASMLVHESLRQQFCASAKLIKQIAAVMAASTDDGSTFLAACGALRVTTLSDDSRSRVSKGLEHAKQATELGLLPLILTAARGPMAQQTGQLAELLATLSRLTVTDQICSSLASMDALSLAITELANHMTDAGVAKQACFFLSNISGNDGCKSSIVRASGHLAIIQAMLLHPNNAAMQTDAVAALGNMCLRMPQNCEAIAAAGGIPPIVAAFSQHLGYARMQSKGCLAVRNLVSRNEELREPLLKEGVERVLRDVLVANPDEGYVRNLAIAGLRDLHCAVEMKERFQGEVGNSHTLEMGDANGENHWDNFLETPVAQEAIKREMEELATY